MNPLLKAPMIPIRNIYEAPMNPILILNAARRPPRPGRMLGGKHDARSGAFTFAGYRGAASTG